MLNFSSPFSRTEQMMNGLKTLSAAVLVATLGMAAQAAPVTIMSDDFSSAAGALNGSALDLGGTWSANNPFAYNGSGIGTASSPTSQGSAVVDFTPLANRIYTVSLDVTNTSAQWIGLGFTSSSAVSSPGSTKSGDRFSNADTPGYAWMLFRDGASASLADADTFAGLRATNSYTENSSATVSTQAGTHSLKVVINTSGDGTSFTNDFFLDGVSITGGPQSNAANISVLNAVGFSVSAGDASITYDNFLVTEEVVPEPGSLALLGLGGVLMMARRRKN